MTKKLVSINPIDVLLIFIPVAIVMEYFLHPQPVYLFLASALAIVPLAGLMGKATEHLAAHLGEGLGGLLNATFGNAAELIIAFLAMRAGLFDLVKASVTGSIIGNLLLVFGMSVLAGGIRYPLQQFNRTAASMATTMLVLSSIALVVPAIFRDVASGDVLTMERELSLEISIVLMVCYALSLLFSLRTHRHLYVGECEAGKETGSAPHWSITRGIAVLLSATALVAWMSEFLVGATESTARAFGMSQVFVGVILVAIIGNAAEHSTAILMAMKNKMDLAIHIAVGSSIQIALFVAPMLVFLSYFVGPAPMDLQFTRFEVLAVVLASGVMALIAQDGESNWMEGVQLLAVYVILAIAFYFLPS